VNKDGGTWRLRRVGGPRTCGGSQIVERAWGKGGEREGGRGGGWRGWVAGGTKKRSAWKPGSREKILRDKTERGKDRRTGGGDLPTRGHPCAKPALSQSHLSRNSAGFLVPRGKVQGADVAN